MLRKSLRRPVVLVGAACTSVLMGVVFFDRVLYHPRLAMPLSKLCSSCSNASSHASYIHLRKFETTTHFEDSIVKRLDSVFLGSNTPIEDRFVVGVSANLGASFFSIIDGHKGTHCSQYLQGNMLQRLSSLLHDGANTEDDLSVVLDMDAVERNVLLRDSEGNVKAPPLVPGGNGVGKPGGVSAEKIEEALRESFIGLDDIMSRSALEEVKLVVSGHMMSAEMRAKILTAIEGACALTAMVHERGVAVANTGDCRVVLGRRGKGRGKWEALPLSVDQNAQNPDEVMRLKAAHPGEEEGTLIVGGRVLGNLMPFRSFGDVDYKWERRHLEKLLQVPANYKTPPYVTAEPVLSRHEFGEGDKFLILATDGFWERVSSERAVDIVGSLLTHSEKASSSGSRARVRQGDAQRRPCCDANIATELLWQALGADDGTVSQLLQLDPRFSRMYRDDITIMVVYL